MLEVTRRGDEAVNFVEGGGEPFQEGQEVRQEVDWGRRFDHMQQHTGQHLVTPTFCISFCGCCLFTWCFVVAAAVFASAVPSERLVVAASGRAATALLLFLLLLFLLYDLLLLLMLLDLLL